MTLGQLFRKAVSELEKRGLAFAVAGAFAADLYRQDPRVTMDIDLGILCDEGAEIVAVSILKGLGLRAVLVREADLKGGPLFAIKARNTTPLIAVGRPPDNPKGFGVDILLPAMPWMGDAVSRAQSNMVDFGFGRVATLTLEDVIAAKLFALRSVPVRAKDLDDLQSIMAAGHTIDRAYLSGRIRRLGITLPTVAKPLLPEALKELIAG